MFGGCVSQTAMTTIPTNMHATVTSGCVRRHRNDSAIAVITARFSQSGPSSSEFVARSTVAIDDQAGDQDARSSVRQSRSLSPRRRLPHQDSSSSGSVALTRKPPASIRSARRWPP